MLVGLVGQIGSGKSEVAAIFREFGAFIISADKIGKDVVEKNPAVLKRLARTFGSDILTPSGRLRRKRLGRLAFAGEKSMARLNAIVHPYLLKELARQSKAASRKYKMVVIDAALLVDWGWHKKVDLTILVHAKKEILVSRLIKKGYSRQEALERIRAQQTYSTLRKASNLVISNNGTIKDLRPKVERIVNRLTRNGLTL